MYLTFEQRILVKKEEGVGFEPTYLRRAFVPYPDPLAASRPSELTFENCRRTRNLSATPPLSEVAGLSPAAFAISHLHHGFAVAFLSFRLLLHKECKEYYCRHKDNRDGVQHLDERVDCWPRGVFERVTYSVAHYGCCVHWSLLPPVMPELDVLLCVFPGGPAVSHHKGKEYS